MMPKKFALANAMFHTEFGSWPRVVCEITEGRYKYLFEGMKPQLSSGEAPGRTKKRVVEDELQPMFSQM